jgi:hypothetical protein
MSLVISQQQGSQMDARKFRDIFLDAAIVDFDLSQWDKRLRLVVVATEETYLAKGGILPIYAVDFERISNLHLEIFHLQEEIEGHYQWNATFKSVKNDNDRWNIELSSFPKLVTTKIACENVNITPIEKSVIDAVCPGWGKPGSPLARAGILEMAERMTRARLQL